MANTKNPTAKSSRENIQEDAELDQQKKTTKKTAPVKEPEQDTAKSEETTTETVVTPSAEEWIALQAQLEALTAELTAVNDKYLRLAAEYDNFRKRSTHDRELARAEATETALKNILPIGDDLARAEAFSDPAAVSKGIEMMQKSFAAALNNLGITEIEAKGQPFDPELHNAVMHVEDESLGENVVVEVLQRGYRRGDRVLRYAMVKVAN